MKKRTKQERREKIQEVLEGYRRFDYDYIPFGTHWKNPDETYRYRGNAADHVATGFWRTVTFLLAYPAMRLLYGVKITGKENLRALGKKQGAICVCNHFSLLDTLFVRLAVGHYRSFHTMAPQNNKTGLGGHIIRHGGMLPFSPNLSAMRNLNAEMGRLLQKGKIVNIYSEQAMWINYRKPRPMKDGVFFYAAKHSVPVLPIFCTFEKTARGRMKKLRIHILPAVWTDETLPKKQRMAEMRRAAEGAWKECYERAYGIPLEYLPDRRKNAPKARQ